MEPVVYAVVVVLISFWSPGNVQVVFECLHSLENLDTCVNWQVIVFLDTNYDWNLGILTVSGLPSFLPSLCPPAAFFAWFMWYCHCPPLAPILPFAKWGQKEGNDNITWTMQKRPQEGIKRAKKEGKTKGKTKGKNRGQKEGKFYELWNYLKN